MNGDVRRLTGLRSEVRSGYYRCRREIRLAHDLRLRRLLELSAFVRWRIARSIDGFIATQHAGVSRMRPSLLDLASSLALQAQGALLADRSLPVLRWLADDTAHLRHSIELCSASSVSLAIVGLLGERLEELKPAQQAVARLLTHVAHLDAAMVAPLRSSSNAMDRQASH